MKIARIPPPEQPIATELDMEVLGALLPDPRTLSPAEVVFYSDLIDRFGNSVGYAQMADEKLR